MFIVDENEEFTEQSMNPDVQGQDLRFAFDRPEYRVMLVADKFQTGFDQPKLVAMYVDKKIANHVEIVQTFSRLNRTAPGKDEVFIIDFVNDPENVRQAFTTYDKGAHIDEVQDLNVVYEIKERLTSTACTTRRTWLRSRKHASRPSATSPIPNRHSTRRCMPPLLERRPCITTR